MKYLNVVATRGGRTFIGDAITQKLHEIEETIDTKIVKIAAVVPRILTVFGTIPQRFEVTEVEIILELEEDKNAEYNLRFLDMETENRRLQNKITEQTGIITRLQAQVNEKEQVQDGE